MVVEVGALQGGDLTRVCQDSKQVYYLSKLVYIVTKGIKMVQIWKVQNACITYILKDVCFKMTPKFGSMVLFYILTKS